MGDPLSRRLNFETCTIDLDARVVIRRTDVRLTPLEWALLDYLAAQHGRAVERDELLEAVWGYRAGVQTRAVDNTVARLRKKIEAQPRKPRHLLSLRGGGYRLVVSLPGEGEGADGEPSAADRADVMAAASRALEAGRVATLVGPAGVGKTWTARQYMADVAVSHPGGVYFCDVGEARDRAAVEAALATHFGTTGDLGAVLAARGKALVVIDNFEQVVGAASETVGRWARAAPDARFIVTSQLPLGLSEEALIAVEPLSVESAVQLFVLRAKAVGGAPDDDDPDLRALVEQLDRLPLAIELAAALAGMLSTAELLANLSERLKLLKDRDNAMQARHRTLRIALEASFALLPEDQRAALLQCSVFHGGFTASDAAAVISPAGASLIDALHGLRQANLLFTEDGGQLALYKSVRALAAELLAAAPEIEQVARRRHAGWAAAFARPDFLVTLREQDAPRHRRRICRQRESLLAAASWAAEAGEPALAVGACRAALKVMDILGADDAAPALVRQVCATPGVSEADADRLTLTALQLRRGTTAAEAIAATCEALTERAEARGDREQLADVLLCQGWLDVRSGAWVEAERRYLEALDHFEALELPRRTIPARLGAGVACRKRNDHEASRVHLEHALTISQSLSDRYGEGMALSNLGTLWNARGRPDRAKSYFEAGARVFGDAFPEQLSVTQNNLGMVQVKLGELEAAEASFQSALEAARRLGRREHEVGVLSMLAPLQAMLERYTEAESNYLAAEHFYESVGNRRAVGIAMGNRGGMYLRFEDYDTAKACLKEAVAILAETGHDAAVGAFQASHAQACVGLGELEEAAALTEEAVARVRRTRHTGALAQVLCVRGEVQARLRDLDGARACLAEVTAIAEALSIGADGPLMKQLNQLRQTIDEQSG